MITIIFFLSIIFYEEKNYKRNVKLIFLSGFLVFTNTIILYILSSSLKSLSASSSLIGLFMILIIIIKKKDIFNTFCEGFLISLVFFINLHALSLLVAGIKFSFASEGVSIFGIEIYQSLVSYSTLVSFFFGALVLNKNLLYFSSILENKTINNLIYFITLFSCLIVVLFLSRRLAFLICLFYLFIWLILNLNKIRKKFPIFIYIFIIGIFSIISVINKFFFTGLRSINYEFMIKPRLSNIHKIINEILIGNDYDLLLGKMKGWGNIENGYLDIMLNSGIVGLVSVFITLIILLYGLSRKIGFLIIKKQKTNIILSFFVLCFIGIVNNPISTPYFFVSFFIILVIFLSKKNKENEV